MLNIALPKGRLGDKVYKLLSSIGYSCKDMLEDNRKLIFRDETNDVSYFWVKPSDVAIYVELGAADIGVVGKDILVEGNSDVYELLDLKLGKCRMAVAGMRDFYDDQNRPLKVATKFVNTAKDYYTSINREVDVIKLNGSIELAPLLGMSDVIVDIVETGTTLKENNLVVMTEIMRISTRLISNKTSYKFKGEQIDLLVNKLEEIVR